MNTVVTKTGQSETFYKIKHIAQRCNEDFIIYCPGTSQVLKAAYSVTINIFQKKKYFLFKSYVKVELSYVFTIKISVS